MKDIIIQRRKKLNMTQRDLAEKLNVSDKAVSRWETGASMPDVGLLKSLAEVLHISLNDLFANAEVLSSINHEIVKPKEEKKAILLFQSLFLSAMGSLLLGAIFIWFIWLGIVSLTIGIVLFVIGIILLFINVIIFKSFYSNFKDKRKYDKILYNWYSSIVIIFIAITVYFIVNKNIIGTFIGDSFSFFNCCILLVLFKISNTRVKRNSLNKVMISSFLIILILLFSFMIFFNVNDYLMDNHDLILSNSFQIICILFISYLLLQKKEY